MVGMGSRMDGMPRPIFLTSSPERPVTPESPGPPYKMKRTVIIDNKSILKHRYNRGT